MKISIIKLVTIALDRFLNRKRYLKNAFSILQVQEAIARTVIGRTVLIIAHRLSTIRHADKILVLYHGEIVEQGTHSELLDKRGLYYDLVKRQTEQHELERNSHTTAWT